jgi:hypothetical protein
MADVTFPAVDADQMKPQGRYRIAAQGPSGEIMDLGECVCEGYGDWKSPETGSSVEFVVLWGDGSNQPRLVDVDSILTVEPIE